ncbi:MAG: hypothetical protein QF785_05365 [Phycisphaeraceae bacterium]|nr:hypothetical protein [Phycisphaeraceae bacterium]
MVVFTGTYERTVDGKHRLGIPSDLRALLAGSAQDDARPVLYVTLGEGQALYLYTESGYEQRAQELLNTQADDQLLDFERLFFSTSSRVEMDKQGRVLLPELLLKWAKIGTDVVLLGANDHMELRDRDTWYTYLEQRLSEQHNQLVNPRRVLGLGPAPLRPD